MGYKTFKSKPKMIGDQPVTNRVKADFLESTLMKVDGLIINRTVISSSYVMRRTEYFIGIDTHNATGSVIISLPFASGSVNGRTYIIKDEGGMADTKNIIIDTQNGDTIDGQDILVVDSPYASLNVYTNGNNKWFIY
jgi:hypothetical protein